MAAPSAAVAAPASGSAPSRPALGRANPLAPIARYVPPDLDFAGISSRMEFSERVDAPEMIEDLRPLPPAA